MNGVGGGDANNQDIKEPERIIALRIVNDYEKIFSYLDFKPVDGNTYI
jgi:hypothetical protein